MDKFARWMLASQLFGLWMVADLVTGAGFFLFPLMWKVNKRIVLVLLGKMFLQNIGDFAQGQQTLAVFPTMIDFKTFQPNDNLKAILLKWVPVFGSLGSIVPPTYGMPLTIIAIIGILILDIILLSSVALSAYYGLKGIKALWRLKKQVQRELGSRLNSPVHL